MPTFDFLDRFTEETLQIMTMVIIGLTVLTGMYYLMVFVNPTTIFNPLAPRATVTLTPTRLLLLEPTWTPTPSPPPTATFTPLPSRTPLPTRTPKPSPTLSPTITDTPTKPPPPPPPPTFTPTMTPMPVQVREMKAGSDCNWTGVYGVVYDSHEQPLDRVEVRAWNNLGWKSEPFITTSDGEFGLTFANEPLEGKWYVQVFRPDNHEPLSPVVEFYTGDGCIYGKQRFWITWETIYYIPEWDLIFKSEM